MFTFPKMSDNLVVPKIDKNRTNFREFLNEGTRALSSIFEKPTFSEEEKAKLEQMCCLKKNLKNINVNRFIPGETDLRPMQYLNVTYEEKRKRIAQIAAALKTNKKTPAKSCLSKKMLNAVKSKRKSESEKSEYTFKLAPLPPALNESGAFKNIEDSLVVTVRVYQPARISANKKQINHMLFSEEFKCLGSNYLTDLRDKISCLHNDYDFIDISENPYTKEHKKSTDPGYFFIDNTFYNDTRNPNNADYSKTFIDWSKNIPQLANEVFTVAKMENTRFIDLTARVGAAYLYLHHAKCEHLFIISQLEILEMATPNRYAVTAYPYLTSSDPPRRRLCHICAEFPYHYVVNNADRHPNEFAYLCGYCFFLFHYNNNNKKIGKFKAFRFYDFEQKFLNEATHHCDEEQLLRPKYWSQAREYFRKYKNQQIEQIKQQQQQKQKLDEQKIVEQTA